MKKKTKKLMKELGKSRRQINRDNFQREVKKQIGCKRRGSGEGSKKNYKHTRPIAFTVPGKRHLKFCKAIALTTQLRRELGRAVMKILLPEIKADANLLPLISIYRDTKNRQLILRNDLVASEEYLVTDENGNLKFEPDTEFAANRFKSGVLSQKGDD